MKRVTPVFLTAAGFLILLDVVGAVTGQPLGFPYSSLGVVSLVVYFTVGLLAAWWSSFTAGIVAGMAVGFLDGTLGPLAAWLVGPGPVSQTIPEPGIFAYSVAVVTATAAVAGLIGATAGSWLERRRTFRSSGVVPRS
jgi:hypothetical protein